MEAHRADRLALLAVAGFACLLTAAAVALVDQSTGPWTWGPAALGLAALLAFFLLRPSPRLSGALGRIGLGVIVLLAVAAGVNLLSARAFVRLDLTELRGYSLAAETLNVLAGLKAPVSVAAFISETDYRARVADKLLGEYADRSAWITYERIDPERQPSALAARGVTRYGTLLFESGEKRQEITSADEESITSALLRMSSDRQPAVYFLAGEGERDVESAERPGYNVIKWHLENKGYRVASLDLASQPAMPGSGDVLVVASPRQSFPAERQTAVADYLRGGGKLIVLLDAGLPDPFPAVLADWGVQPVDNLVFDPSSNYFGDAGTPLVGRFPASSLTRGLEGLSAFFPAAREVRPADPAPDGIQVTPLVVTTEGSWGEMDLTAPQASFDVAGGDHRGPVSLAVSARGSLGAGRGAAAAGARLVVFGDSDFISNAALSSTDASLGNAALFLNAVKWASEDESLIHLTAINTDVRRVILTGRQMRLIGYASMLFAPLLAVFAGALTWWRQR